MNRGRHKKIYNSYIVELKNPKTFITVFNNNDIEQILKYQSEAGSPKDLKVFEEDPWASRDGKGFDWYETEEGFEYWHIKFNKYFALK